MKAKLRLSQIVALIGSVIVLVSGCTPDPVLPGSTTTTTSSTSTSTTSTTTIPNPYAGMQVIKDSTGVILGTPVDPNHPFDAVRNIDLNRIISLSNSSQYLGISTGGYYSSVDCTGQPFFISNYNGLYDQLLFLTFPIGLPNPYVVVDPNDGLNTIGPRSESNGSGVCGQNNSNYTQYLPLHQVVIPFDFPLHLPLSVETG